MKIALARIGVILIGALACGVIVEVTDLNPEVVAAGVFYVVGNTCAKYLPFDD